jgi:hypothetical protein
LAAAVADLGPELLYRGLADIVSEAAAHEEISQPAPEVAELQAPKRL